MSSGLVFSSLFERKLISQSDLKEHVQQSGPLAAIFFFQCVKSQKIVLESIDILKANGLTDRADMLSGEMLLSTSSKWFFLVWVVCSLYL